MPEHEKTWAQLLSAPRDFMHGLLGGLLAPALALAGAVGMLYVLTGHLPALKKVTKTDGTQRKALTLASPLEARATWARYGGDLRAALLENKARRHPRTDTRYP